VYVQRICTRLAVGFVPDYIAMGADVALAIASFIGVYYAFVSSRLFRGDLIMERVWRLATIAFVVVGFVSALDFLFTATSSPLVQFDLGRIAAVFALAIFVVALMTLVRWGKSTESGTQQSRRYPPR